MNRMAPSRHKAHKEDTNKECKTEQYDIDRHGVAVESAMRDGVETGLGEVEEAREADDEAVDFAEGGEAKDFG